MTSVLATPGHQGRLLGLPRLADRVVDLAARGLPGQEVRPERGRAHQRERPVAVAPDVADHRVAVPGELRTDEDVGSRVGGFGHRESERENRWSQDQNRSSRCSSP